VVWSVALAESQHTYKMMSPRRNAARVMTIESVHSDGSKQLENLERY